MKTTKKRYCFCLDGNVSKMLTKLSRQDRRSRSNMLEMLIRVAAGEPVAQDITTTGNDG